MSTPQVNRSAVAGVETAVIRATDGGTNDALPVELTGTSTGRLYAVTPTPSATARGSQAATGSSVALGAATTYTGGIYIWNSDVSLPVFIGTGTITAAAGANKVCLGPGQGYVEPTGDLSALQIIAASGSPIVNWIGLTL